MATCDSCGKLRLRAQLARTEAATVDEHGDVVEGLLCRDCWPDEWAWPHDRTGAGVAHRG